MSKQACYLSDGGHGVKRINRGKGKHKAQLFPVWRAAHHHGEAFVNKMPFLLFINEVMLGTGRATEIEETKGKTGKEREEKKNTKRDKRKRETQLQRCSSN